MTLEDECGHHCGTMMTGAHQYSGHCPCSDCHHTDPVADVERCKFRPIDVGNDSIGFGPRCTKKKKHDSKHDVDIDPLIRE